MDNIVINTPPPPVQDLRASFRQGQWQATFSGRTNWSYILESTEDFRSWNPVTAPASATSSQLTLKDSSGTSGRSRFYRIKAQRTN
jgi:hypothetical protein